MAEAALAACRSCCVVSVSPAGGGGAALEGRSGSGVVLSRSAGAVLCHGALFAPFLAQAERSGAAVLRHGLPAHLQIRVLLQPHSPPGLGRTHGRAWQREGGAAAVQCRPLGGGSESAAAELVVLAPCRPFQEALARVFGAAEHWRFGPEEEEEESGGEAGEQPRLLHWFALLRLRGGVRRSWAGWLSCGPAALVRKGEALLACGSPFGALCPDLFLNCLSRGVVSNAAGQGNALLLTDARCLPGTEGGGVFALNGPGARLVAIIVAPLCWKAGEWVGLTLLCAADCVLRSLRAALAEQRPALEAWLPPLPPCARPPEAAPATVPPVRHMLAAVVLVECGLAWGSGVLLGPRLVLTCRHVVSGASVGQVRIQRLGPDFEQ